MMIRRGCELLLTALISLCLFSTAHGADIAVAPQASSYATRDLSPVFRTIHIAGAIEPGDAQKLRNLLLGLAATPAKPANALIVAELSGTEGDYYEAMALGYILRDFRVATVVRKGARCLSACVLAFLGGASTGQAPEISAPRRYLEVGGVVGFRNYYSKLARGQAAPSYPVQGLVDYSLRMGVERGFQKSLLNVEPGQFAYVDTVKEFLVARICPIGIGASTLSLTEQAANVCSHAIHWFDPDAPTKATPITAVAAKRVLLEAARRSTAPRIGEKDVAWDLNSRSYMQSEMETGKVYDRLREIGLSLPDLRGTIFEVSGYRAGVYGVECIVSFSPDDPDRYDLVAQAPMGGSATPSLQAVPVTCGGLARRADDEVINPRSD